MIASLVVTLFSILPRSLLTRSTLRTNLKLSLPTLSVFIMHWAALTLNLQAQDYRHLRQEQTPTGYASLEDWLGRATELRTHILVSTGIWPLPEKTPLKPTLSEPLKRQNYSIQNIALETFPGLFLTGNLYRPLDGSGPFPALLSPHGHWKKGRLEDNSTSSVPGRAINFALQGYVVFTYSMIGYNETANQPGWLEFAHAREPDTFDRTRALSRSSQQQTFELWGFSPLGLQLWNSLRALDFLASLPEVDKERIGMTGASGGGTQTFLLTAIDPRIRVAAPVNMISAHFQGGCVCENAALLRLDTNNIDIGALAAPRPLLMVSTSGDWTKNTPEVEFPAVQAIYRLFKAEGRVANIHLNYEHNYNRESREAVYGFFSRWLLNSDRAAPEKPFHVEEESVLSARLPLPSRSPQDIFQSFVRQAQAQIETHKPANWSRIHEYRKVFGAAMRRVLEQGVGSPDVDWEVFKPALRTESSPAVLIVHPRGAAAGEAREIAETYRQRGRLAFVLHPYAQADTFEIPENVEFWTGYNPTVSSRRINDIRTAARRILARPDVSGLDLVGLDQAGPWALLARSLLPKVDHTVADFNELGFESDAQLAEHLFIPLLRRAGDFRTAAAMMVPAPVTLWNLPEGPVKSWFRDVYHAGGASEMLQLRKGQVIIAPRSKSGLK